MKFGFLKFILIAAIPASCYAGPKQDKAKEAAMTWGACVIDKAERFADQQEAAETLAQAALGMCIEEGTAFKLLYAESTREYGLSFKPTAPSEKIDAAYRTMETEISKMAIAKIIQIRAGE